MVDLYVWGVDGCEVDELRVVQDLFETGIRTEKIVSPHNRSFKIIRADVPNFGALRDLVRRDDKEYIVRPLLMHRHTNDKGMLPQQFYHRLGKLVLSICEKYGVKELTVATEGTYMTKRGDRRIDFIKSGVLNTLIYLQEGSHESPVDLIPPKRVDGEETKYGDTHLTVRKDILGEYVFNDGLGEDDDFREESYVSAWIGGGPFINPPLRRPENLEEVAEGA